MNLVLTRIDDRLIHGQVMTAWVKYNQANKIIIVDNEVVNDPFMMKVLKMTAPSDIIVEAYGVQEAAEVLKQDGTPGERVVVLVKCPQAILGLLEGGVSIKEVIIGGMGAKPGRKSLYKNISASLEEKEILRKIIQKGTRVTIRIVPDDKGTDVEKYL